MWMSVGVLVTAARGAARGRGQGTVDEIGRPAAPISVAGMMVAMLTMPLATGETATASTSGATVPIGIVTGKGTEVRMGAAASGTAHRPRR